MTRPGDRPITGILLALAGMGLLTTTDMLVKLNVSEDLSVAQLVFLRGVMIVAVMLLLLPKMGGYPALKSNRWRLLLIRGLIGSIAPFAYFTGLQYVPIAELTVISFVSVFIGVGLSVLMLGEKLHIQRALAILVGFVGVLVVIRPGADVFQPAALLGIVAASAYAMMMILTRMAATTESAFIQVFSFNAILGVFCGVIALFSWQPVTTDQLLIIFIIGCVSLTADYLLVKAYGLASVGILMPIDYSALIWAALYGYAIFGEAMDLFDWFGAVLIILAGLFIGWWENRQTQRYRSYSPS